jgi:hypothetical protein
MKRDWKTEIDDDDDDDYNETKICNISYISV